MSISGSNANCRFYETENGIIDPEFQYQTIAAAVRLCYPEWEIKYFSHVKGCDNVIKIENRCGEQEKFFFYVDRSTYQEIVKAMDNRQISRAPMNIKASIQLMKNLENPVFRLWFRQGRAAGEKLKAGEYPDATGVDIFEMVVPEYYQSSDLVQRAFFQGMYVSTLINDYTKDSVNEQE